MDAEEGLHAFFTAIREGHMEEVTRLLDGDPHLMKASTEYFDRTPLVVAAIYGHADVVGLLIERGADVNAIDNNELTALQNAAREGHEEVVRVLLSRGADSNRKGFDGSTALIRASRGGHLGVVRQLLQHMVGRGLDEGNDNGFTALWWACFNGHVEIARILLLAGADATITDRDGRTPRRAAELFGKPACVPLLVVSGTCSGRWGHAFGKQMEKRWFRTVVYIRESLLNRPDAVIALAVVGRRAGAWLCNLPR
jgi:hypothetical protein